MVKDSSSKNFKSEARSKSNSKTNKTLKSPFGIGINKDNKSCEFPYIL